MFGVFGPALESAIFRIDSPARPATGAGGRIRRIWYAAQNPTDPTTGTGLSISQAASAGVASFRRGVRIGELISLPGTARPGPTIVVVLIGAIAFARRLAVAEWQSRRLERK